jgi:plasmid stabilization system protein ParE
MGGDRAPLHLVTGLPYIIVYEVADERTLTILGVFHGAQEKGEI